MIRSFFILVLLLLLSQSYVFAHSLLMNVYSEDGETITIEGKFDTGTLAPGALLTLEALNTGDILYQERLPWESEVTISIPDEPYKIILDGGPMHIIEKDGIPPEKGFTVQQTAKPQANKPESPVLKKPLAFALITTMFLLVLTIIVSIVNTRKLIAALEANRKL